MHVLGREPAGKEMQAVHCRGAVRAQLLEADWALQKSAECRHGQKLPNLQVIAPMGHQQWIGALTNSCPLCFALYAGQNVHNVAIEIKESMTFVHSDNTLIWTPANLPAHP